SGAADERHIWLKRDVIAQGAIGFITNHLWQLLAFFRDSIQYRQYRIQGKIFYHRFDPFKLLFAEVFGI
ncbi:MAG: hypothetical protein WCD88_11100, partial [Desulfobacterales bacterium]